MTPRIVMVDKITNPIAAIRRSWALTQGQTGRLLGFYALIMVVFLVIVIAVQALLGALLALVAGPEAARIGLALVLGGVQGVMAVYFIAITAAVHRQLAGIDGRAIRATFD